MTKSPLAATLNPLIPLVALGWPLARVINQDAFVQPPVENAAIGPLATADLSVLSAHPFDSVTVTVGEANWIFAPDETVKEIHYPRGASITLTTTVIWPEGTPETATLVTLRPQGESDQTHTIWGLREATEEITFTWNSQE